MKFTFTSQPIDRVNAELVLLMHHENAVPFRDAMGLIDWRVNGKLSRLVQDKVFTGKAREMVLMPAENRFKAQKLVLLGLGPREAFETGHIPQVFDFVFDTVKRIQAGQVCLSISTLVPAQYEWRQAVRAFMTRAPGDAVLDEVIFCEPAEFVAEAKRRQDEFVPGHLLSFE